MKWILETLLVIVFLYIIESLNALTGFPFGFEYYSESWGPAPFGLVPLLVPVLSAFPVMAAVFIALHFKWKDLAWIFGTAGLVVLFMLFIEPIGVNLHLWYFRNGGFLFGVPLSAFAGWLFTVSSLAFLRRYDKTEPEVAS